MEYERTLNGRAVKFKSASGGQLAMLRRLAGRTEYAEDRARAGAEMIVALIDVVESMIVDDADRRFLSDGLLSGKIEHTDLYQVLSGPETSA